MNQWLNNIQIILLSTVHPSQLSRFCCLHSSSWCSFVALSLQQINTTLCLFLSFFLPISLIQTQTGAWTHAPDKKKKINCVFKQGLLFSSLLWAGSGRGCQQIVCVQWIAAQESINWGLCKWTEQGHNQLQSPAKSCLLTPLLKHAGKLTALDLSGWSGGGWRRNMVWHFQKRWIITVKEMCREDTQA